MTKEKVNHQEVYDLYLLCSKTKNIRKFCADYGVNYDKFMNWLRYQLWNEKLGRTVQGENSKSLKYRLPVSPAYKCHFIKEMHHI